MHADSANWNNSKSASVAAETTDEPMRSAIEASTSAAQKISRNVTSSIDERTETCPIRRRRRRRRRSRVSPPRAALTRLAERPAAAREVWRRRTPRPRRKNNASWRRPRPPRGRGGAPLGAPLGGARGRGVGAGAAGGQSFDACRASGCRHGTSECRERAAGRRVMDVA